MLEAYFIESTMYVLVRNEDNKFVAPPGQDKSYTSDLTKAWIFSTNEAAKRQACGNERVVPVAELFRWIDPAQGR